MSRVIAFSGGCFSGKTTTMKIVKEQLESAGYKVTVLDEIIRTVTDKPIDEIRKNPSSYLALQEKIINAKIEQENIAFRSGSDTIFLADRAITDSLFYLQNYVDKSNLTPGEMERFCKLHHTTVRHARKAVGYCYFAIIEFRPLIGINTDTFRPKNIDFSKEYEYEAIHTLNKSFWYGPVYYERIDLNIKTHESVANSIISVLKRGIKNDKRI